MNLIHGAIRQPVTVAVGVILVLLAGVVALRRIPIQLTPNVEDTIIAVTTRWEGASPEEIEQEIVDPQEEKLQGIANLIEMTSSSVQGTGTLRLRFAVGTSKELALREVSDKLREVPEYPETADEPVIEASDPENQDYIAWIVFETDDPSLDIRTLQDFAEDRIKPNFERVPGISEINVLGGRERETQVRFDAVRLAQRGVTVSQLVSALRRTNLNVSAGEVAENKSDVRVRLVSQFHSPEQVLKTVIAQTDAGPVRVEDVATVVEDFKEATSFVRSSGNPVIAINAQKEVGVNVMQVMTGLQDAIERMNAPGGLLEAEARRRGLQGEIWLRQVYDQTIYIDDALQLVQNNILFGGALAVAVLLLFLRSLRSSAIVALAIPISVVGAVALMISIGRTVNVISLAGMAFAIGMVVDNAIVVLENVYRHLEMGKRPMQAAFDGTREVFGAVVAATLTTVVVFIPILLIEDEAGQLFRDISIAIVFAVLLSLAVSVTVIPAASARLLGQKAYAREASGGRRGVPFFRNVPDWIGRFTYWTGGSVLARLLIVVGLTAASLVGTVWLLPPADYLPQGNRNLVFGLLIPPPGYNIDQSIELARRIEGSVEPFWEAGKHETGSPEYEEAKAELPQIPSYGFMTGLPPGTVTPPPLDNYFIVSFPGRMFHGGISSEPERVVEHKALFTHATRAEQAPGVIAFAFQVPLFRLGGSTGAAVKINLSGDDLDEVTGAALSVFLDLMAEYGGQSTQPDPSNFNIPGPELRVEPDLVRLSEVGLSPTELGDSVRALGDGAIIGDYRVGGENIDLKVMSNESLTRPTLQSIGDTPVATPLGGVMPLDTLGSLTRVNSPPQINRIGRRRAVTLQFTPPAGMPVEQAVSSIEALIQEKRDAGAIPPTVITSYTGTASKLASVQEAMFGDGTFTGTIGSAMVLALLVVYLLMCALFQSFLRPLVIMFSVPLATLGGFAALYGVHAWSLVDPYLPVQNLDILTVLGFVILIGVVVNNAILIVHQSRNFMLGLDGEPLPPRRAIAEAVRTRVRPIFMGSLTSVGGMAPLVFMPGSGSELYRGLGSVVVGGLIVSTVFTLLLVPALFGLVTQLQEKLNLLAETKEQESFGPAARRATVGGLLLALLVTVPGCMGPREMPPRRTGAVLHDVVQAQLDELDDLNDQRQEVAPGRTGVEEALSDRLGELEAESGLSTLGAGGLDLPTPLDGAGGRVREIPLVWAVGSATENNLAVRFSRERVAIERENYVIAAAEFDPTLFSDLELGSSDEPRTVPVIGGIPIGTPESVGENASLRAGVRKLVESGGTLEASTSLQWADDRTDGIQFSPDPSNRSDLALTFTQPLLAGRGSLVTTAERTLRRNQYERSEQILREDLAFVLESTELAYWDLVEAWKVLAIQQQLTRRGEEVERVLGERRAFDATPAEYSDALATVEARRANLVRAQRIVAQASDRLKQLVNDPEVPLEGEELLLPTESLEAGPYEYQMRRLMLTALRQRPEVQAAVISIEDTELRDAVASNLREPILDLRVGGSLVGLDGEFDDSYAGMFEDEHYTLFAGLQFELPVGNRAARARERQAQRENRAAILEYEQVVRDVLLEVKQALRDVRTNLELVEATRAFRLAQTENLRSLEAEREARSELTPEFLNLVFQRQEGLAGAQLDEVRARTDYNRALAALHRAVGGGGGAERIELSRREHP